MKEVLYEESATPKNLKFQKIIFIVYTVLIWIFGIIDVLTLLFYPAAYWVGMIVTLVFFTGSGVGFWFLRKQIYYCVDLVFVTGQTRIIKVVHFKFRRKK